MTGAEIIFLRDGRVSLAEADGPGFESFRIAIFVTVKGNFRGHGGGVFSQTLRDLESNR